MKENYIIFIESDVKGCDIRNDLFLYCTFREAVELMTSIARGEIWNGADICHTRLEREWKDGVVCRCSATWTGAEYRR